LINKCFLNNHEFNHKPKIISNISDATIGSTSPSLFSIKTIKKFNKLLDATKHNIWSGDCHNYCLVLRGGLDLVVEEGLSAYDVLPLVPILKSQDIMITDWYGRNLKLENDVFYKYSTIVASNSEIYDQAISLLK
jgi:fructose-1,6-bisphosphatase/inositol monophosphatase family enzyme